MYKKTSRFLFCFESLGRIGKAVCGKLPSLSRDAAPGLRLVIEIKGRDVKEREMERDRDDSHARDEATKLSL
jgi:hypothetical protein